MSGPQACHRNLEFISTVNDFQGLRRHSDASRALKILPVAPQEQLSLPLEGSCWDHSVGSGLSDDNLLVTLL